MSEDEKNQALSEKRSGFSNLQALGIRTLALLLYFLLLDATVETVLSGSPVRWWVFGIVAGYLGMTILLWRRMEWATKATVSFLLLLGLLVFSAWWRWPEGLTKGVILARQPTSTALSAVTALAVLLAGTALVRMRFIPMWGGALIGLLAVYGVAAFGMGIVAGVPYPDLFRWRSLWHTLPFWSPGTLVGALVLSAAVVAQLVYGLLRVRGPELRTWGVQMLALCLSLLMAAAGFGGALRAAPAPFSGTTVTAASPAPSAPAPVPASPQPTPAPTPTPQAKNERGVVLAKGFTEAGEPVSPSTEFPEDVGTIYAILTSTSPNPDIRISMSAVNAKGVSPNTQVADTAGPLFGSTKIVKGREGVTRVVIQLRPREGLFVPGDYRVQVDFYDTDPATDRSLPVKSFPVRILPPAPPLPAVQPGVASRHFEAPTYNSLKKSDVVQSLSLEWSSLPAVAWIEWEGIITVPAAGRYDFKLEGDGNGFLYVDGKRVIRERKEPNDRTPPEGSIELEGGKYTIRAAAIREPAEGKFALHWKKPGDQGYSPIDPQYLSHTEAQGKWKRNPRQAAQVGLEWLQSDSIAWQRQNGCNGCHVQAQAIMGLSVAAQNKYTVSEEYFKALVTFTKGAQTANGSGSFPPASVGEPDPSGGSITATQFAAMALSFFDGLTKAKQNSTLLRSVNWLLTQQKSDGEIPMDDSREPVAQGSIMATANSATAFTQAFKETGDARYKEAAGRALAWIAANKPETTQDKVFKVMALYRDGTAEQKQIGGQVVEQLKAEQLKDGSWKESAREPSDFATGQALCAFKEAGVGVNTLEFRRGVRFLLNSQRITGAWKQGSAESDFARTMWPVICLAGAFVKTEFIPDGTLQLVSDIQRVKKPTKNLVIILDFSGSMNERLGKTTKVATALEVLKEVLEKLPDDFNVGLRLYGHRHPPAKPPKSLGLPTCTDTELLVPVQKLDRGGILSAVSRLKPRGETPLVYSVLQTIGDLKGVGGGSVVLITDGLETCGGNPKTAAEQLKAAGIDITLHIVGFTVGLTPKEKKDLEGEMTAFAEATGGRYFSAQSGEELARGLLIAALDKLPYSIYDAAGKQVAKGETGDPPEELLPGKYRVAVQAVGRELVAENVAIASEKETVLTVVLKADRFSLKEGEKELARDRKAE